MKAQPNFDCTAIFLLSNMHLWPLLARVIQPCCTSVFTFGFYCWRRKPPLCPAFLNKCITELNVTVRKSITSRTKSVRHSFFRDLWYTAWAFVRQVKELTFYFGCDRFIHRGFYSDKLMTFPDLKCKTTMVALVVHGDTLKATLALVSLSPCLQT